MTTLILLRHAETTTGAGRFVGQTDVVLSASGNLQSQTLLHHWPHGRPDIVYTSSLMRTSLSIAPLLAHYTTQANVDPRLDEMHFGDWELLDWPRVEQRSPVLARVWTDDWVNTVVPNGESFAMVKARVAQALSSILAQSYQNQSGATILVVAHAGTIRACLCELLGFSEKYAFSLKLDYLHRYVLVRQYDRWVLTQSNVPPCNTEARM